ncbi:polysaccharide pyruvyl transferase family protein [Devosia sp.]|uniref:polysaccharide pyruvyl transferase family protein n=1 Tax=Devosia sp. TaxID=1871048 RepID=UPI003BA868B8
MSFLRKALASPYRRHLQPRTMAAPGTVILWWGTYGFAGRPTLGDVQSVENLSRELGRRGHEHAILSHPELALPGHWPVADIFSLTQSIRQLAFVCGPLLDRSPLRDFLYVHRRARKLALGVSILPNNESITSRFDVIVARDGISDSTFDFAASEIVPPDPWRANAIRSVGLSLRGPQKEYGPNRVGQSKKCEALLRDLAARMSIPIVQIDTRILPANDTAKIKADFVRSDIIFTTRMHGALLALALGKPVIALDQIPGTAKVTAVLRKIGWPHVYSAEFVTADMLDAACSDLAGPAGVAAVIAAQVRIAEYTEAAVKRAADAFLPG